MILILNIENKFSDWCFSKSIFFYAYTHGCQPGFCKITKWVNEVPTEGQKLFPVLTIQETIESLYRQVYTQSNT